MTYPLLLDEMFSDAIAEQLRLRGHDALAVVADPALRSLPDDQVLAAATVAGRALVTVTSNVRDFVALDQQYKASGLAHAGLILAFAKSFPQDRSFVGSVARALDALLSRQSLRPDVVVFLER